MTTCPQLFLLGSPVAQSKSPVFQNAGLEAIGSEWRYAVKDTDASGVVEVIDRIRSGAIVGANVTMPHKAVAYTGCDEPCPLASALRAVNTLYRDSGGVVVGTNTDVHGVARSVAALGCATGRVVLLGAGGAGAAAAAAVGGIVGELTVVNRSLEKGRAMLHVLQNAGLVPASASVLEWGSAEAVERVVAADLVINSTSLGMKDAAQAAVAFDRLGIANGSGAALDLIYAVGETPFLTQATGRPRLDGATMLVEQGARSFELWTGEPAPLPAMYHALFSALGRPVPEIGDPKNGGGG